MGTPLEPEPPAASGCALCWGTPESILGSGEPPSVVRYSVSGIQKGTSWEPGDPEPQNGIYSIGEFAACRWVNSSFPTGFLFYTAGHSRFLILWEELGLMFRNDVDEDCITFFENENTTPATKYFGGSATMLL